MTGDRPSKELGISGLRQEIQSVHLHQESLLQQYRSLLYTIQSLLLAGFVGLFCGLASLHSQLSGGKYCISKWTTPDALIVLLIFVFIFCAVIIAVGLLVLIRMQDELNRRGLNVSFCRNLLLLDETGELAPSWMVNMKLSNGHYAGMQTALRLYEKRELLETISKFLNTTNFEAIRSIANSVLSVEQEPTRDLFRIKIYRYFLALWIMASVGTILYAPSLIC